MSSSRSTEHQPTAVTIAVTDDYGRDDTSDWADKTAIETERPKLDSSDFETFKETPNEDVAPEKTEPSSRSGNLFYGVGIVFLGLLVEQVNFQRNVNNGYSFATSWKLFAVFVVIPMVSLWVIPLPLFCKWKHLFASLQTHFLVLGNCLKLYYLDKITPSDVALLNGFVIFGSAVTFQVSLKYQLLAAPLYVIMFVICSWSSSDTSNDDFSRALIITIFTPLIMLFSTYSLESESRKKTMALSTAERSKKKLFEQLSMLSDTHLAQLDGFKTPIERAMCLASIIRSDPTLETKHVQNLTTILALLNSSDLTIPDIEAKIHGRNHGRQSLRSYEEEHFILSNLFPARVQGNRKMSSSVDNDMAQSKRRLSAFGPGSMKHLDGRRTSAVVAMNDTGTHRASSPSVLKTRSPPYTPHMSFLNPKSRLSIETSYPPENESLGSADDILDSKFIVPAKSFENIKQKSITLLSSENLRNSAGAKTPNNTNLLVNSALTALKSKSSSSGVLQSSGYNMLHDITEDEVSAVKLDIPEIVKILEGVHEWNLEVFKLDTLSMHRPLFTLANYLFLKHELYEKFEIPVSVFFSFISEIEFGYHPDVPYHNSVHATDVVHGVHYFYERCAKTADLTETELLVLIVAAAIHDYDHPGRNNNFLVNTSEKRALLYNDRSVLENHHLAQAFKVLLKPENNFIAHFEHADYKDFREYLIELVLATDLQSHHFSIMSAFKNKVSLTKSFDPVNIEDDRKLLLKMIIKCADVSNPTKSWHIYNEWTERVLKEFFNQGDEEKLAGIPVSPFYDRHNVNLPGSQLGFIDYICIPLYETFAMFTEISEPYSGILNNRAYWIKERDKEKPAIAGDSNAISRSSSKK